MKAQKKIRPPVWADRLLTRLCRSDQIEEIQGDLYESYYWRVAKYGLKTANRHFIKECFQSLRPSNLKSYQNMDQYLILFKSHIKTGCRYLLKTWKYSIVNIVGLSLGIVFSWFAYLFTIDQMTYNQHLNNVEHLYKMGIGSEISGNKINFPGASHTMTEQVKQQVPEVKTLTRIRAENVILANGQQSFNQEAIISDGSLIDILALKFVEGNSLGFGQLNTLILSESMAYKLGLRDNFLDHPIDIILNGETSVFKVIGLFEDVKNNTSINPKIILPYSFYLSLNTENQTKFNQLQLSVILEFYDSNNIEATNNKLTEAIQNTNDGLRFTSNLTPFETLHLSNTYISGNGFLPGGNQRLIKFIILTGLLCLIISIINYTNFSISLYVSRAREIAVRKIIGSAKKGVFQQLMTESLLTTILSAAIALVLFIVIAPYFSSFVEKKYTLFSLIDWSITPGIILILIIVSLIRGLYPSILLSRFPLLSSLKGTHKVGNSKRINSALLTAQFSISITMMACMLTFQGQLDYLLSFDKGFDIKDVIEIKIPQDLAKNKQVATFYEKLKTEPSILSQATFSGFNMSPFEFDESDGFPLMNAAINNSYMEIMGFSIVEGRSINDAYEAGITDAAVVNEAFLIKTGLTNPIGQKYVFESLDKGAFTIVGVIKDHYLSSPKSQPRPLLYYAKRDANITYNIYMKSKLSIVELSEKIEPLWDELFYPLPLQYEYLAQSYQGKLEQESKTAQIATIGTAVSIFLAGFGLLGLVGLTLKRSRKELSVRRVLGAEFRDIVMKIQKQFIVPILVSLAIGLLASSYFTEKWLENYVNRISYGWTQALIPTFSILALLVLIVTSQVLFLSRTNPVIHLKDE